MTDTARLRRSDWEVRPVAIATARSLITRYHYAHGASRVAVHVHGLFPRGAVSDHECVGVAWWLPPTKHAALATCRDNWKGVLALSRLVLAPSAPRNSASYLIARSARLIDPRRWPVLVTYADTWMSHTGAIYKAAGWKYAGLTRPEPTYTLNGRLLARKNGSRTRTHGEMLALGAICHGRFPRHKWVLDRRRSAGSPAARAVE